MTRMVSDLPNWPPEAGGAKIYGGRTAISSKDVIIRVIIKIRNDQVEFSAYFRRGLVRYIQKTENGRDARAFAKILNDNVGKTLFSIAEIEMPEG
jgi:hypothetical protein